MTLKSLSTPSINIYCIGRIEFIMKREFGVLDGGCFSY